MMKPLMTALLVAMSAGAGLASADEASAVPSIPWKMPSYTLVARDMDLRVALDTFAVAEGLSVVMSESVAGRFSGDKRGLGVDIQTLTWYRSPGPAPAPGQGPGRTPESAGPL